MKVICQNYPNITFSPDATGPIELSYAKTVNN